MADAREIPGVPLVGYGGLLALLGTAIGGQFGGVRIPVGGSLPVNLGVFLVLLGGTRWIAERRASTAARARRAVSSTVVAVGTTFLLIAAVRAYPVVVDPGSQVGDPTMVDAVRNASWVTLLLATGAVGYLEGVYDRTSVADPSWIPLVWRVGLLVVGPVLVWVFAVSQGSVPMLIAVGILSVLVPGLTLGLPGYVFAQWERPTTGESKRPLLPPSEDR